MERLILATTDGRRVSESSVVLAPGQDAGQLGPLLIPGRALAELATVFSDTSFQLSLTPNRSQVLFSTPHLVCSAILQSGEFPNYRAVVPPQRALRVEVSTDELQRLVQQARIFTGAEQRAARFSIQPGAGITPGSLTLSTRNEAGNTYISAPALVRGESTTVSFDIQLIHEALQTVSTPKVVLEIGQATAARTPAPAGILMPIGGDNLHAFMSMKA
jgi:DNA polymerase-3 subunit beta